MRLPPPVHPYLALLGLVLLTLAVFALAGCNGGEFTEPSEGRLVRACPAILLQRPAVDSTGAADSVRVRLDTLGYLCVRGSR